MRWHSLLYFGLFSAHIIFFIVVLRWVFRPSVTHESPVMIHPQFDVPIWSGKISGFREGDENYHSGNIDMIIYGNSLFIGFADQGYPLFSLEREELLGYWMNGREIRLKAKKGKRIFAVTIHGDAKPFALAAKKLQFLMRKK